jgi:hypothetical protein
LLLKNAEDLTAEGQAELEIIFSQSPCLKIAYEMKEELRLIYENRLSFTAGKIKLEKFALCPGILPVSQPNYTSSYFGNL